MTISKDKVERARLLSEYKYIVDNQSQIVQARREGEAKKQAEILAFLNQGGTMEELKQWLATDARQSTAQV
jgi:DNA-binding protein H-NS